MKPSHVRRIALVAFGLVVVAVPILVAAERYWTRYRVDWWLDHAYPVHTNLLPDEQRYFATRDDWVRAGKKIPRLVPILIDQFRGADNWTKVQLLYGLGAASGDQAFHFLMTTATSSSESEEVRSAAFNYGLGQYIDRPEWQGKLLACIHDRTMPLDWCCVFLASLLRVGHAGSREYASTHALKLIEDTESGGTSQDATGVLTRALSDLEISSKDGGQDSTPSR